MGNSSNDWFHFPKWSDEYENGLDVYLEKKFATEAHEDQIACPCKQCDKRYWFFRNEVKEHLICKGFGLREGRTLEHCLDSIAVLDKERVIGDHDGGLENNDNLTELLDNMREGPNDEAKNFFKLVEDGQQELYPGCKNVSKLYFTIRLFLFKYDHKISNAAFGELLELLKEILPNAKLPNSFYEAKSTIRTLGLDYTKIDACPNDCMLYWEEHADATSCHICKASRWKSIDKDEETSKPYQIPAKILRYFPIKKRLQRMFLCSDTANHMLWHAKRETKDGSLRHLADGEAWKEFDRRYGVFVSDPRNVRLGLASDGFSPFNMGIVHSTWPVILMNYNLPPSMCMKQEFLMLALLIPGPLSPCQDIDIYLQPLIKDLNELWEVGVETYDALSGNRFDMHATLVSGRGGRQEE